MKNFKEFVIESYVKAGYLDERGCPVEYLDENVASGLWNTIGRPASNAFTRSFVGDMGSELTGNKNLKPSTPILKGYDKAINTINQKTTKKNDQGQLMGRSGGSKFKRALEVGSNFVPWEKVPGALWSLTKGIAGTVLGGSRLK